MHKAEAYICQVVSTYICAAQSPVKTPNESATCPSPVPPHPALLRTNTALVCSHHRLVWLSQHSPQTEPIQHVPWRENPSTQRVWEPPTAVASTGGRPLLLMAEQPSSAELFQMLFSRSPTDGSWACVWCRATIQRAATTILVHISRQYMVLLFWGKHLGVELLGYKAAMFNFITKL